MWIHFNVQMYSSFNFSNHKDTCLIPRLQTARAKLSVVFKLLFQFLAYSKCLVKFFIFPSSNH